MIQQRLQQVRQRLEQDNLNAIIVSQPENRRYLSGFTGSAGHLFISSRESILATDFRYTEQAKAQAPDYEIIEIKGEIDKWLPGILTRLQASRIAFESADIAVSTFEKFKEAVKQTSGIVVQFVPTVNLVESIRAVKDAEELEKLYRACSLADAAFEYISSYLSAGMTEIAAAWQVEKFLRENGSETTPFEIIVASGSNAALPHARPTDRIIAEGEPVIFDLGARVSGYCSDLSRTICPGTPGEKFIKVYDLVLGAQLTGLTLIKPGLTGSQADRLARTVIEKGGYGASFGHGLGHGVGLAVHEMPRLGLNSSDHLDNGMVFTIEPGVYLPGWGGVRIEDTVMLENGRVKSLTKCKK